MLTASVKAQDVVNPYDNSMSNLGGYYLYNNNQLIHTFLGGGNIGGYYTGEYEINFKELPWYSLFVGPVVNLNFTSQLKFSISYHFETVSFPFIVECSFSGTGDCTQATPCSTHTRNLQLPQEDASHFTYIPNDHCFQYQYLVNNSATDKFYLKTPEYNFLSPFSSGNMGPPPHNAHTLASAGFIRTTGLGFSRNVIPHSIIKPVIKIHCGEDETYPVISEISFYYDNARGRMRYYPFNECNEDFNTSPSEYDVIFAPEYLIGSDIYYNTFDTDILEDGTLNYYPFSEITPTAGCNSNILPDINSSLYNPYFLRDYYINNYPNPVTRANVMYGDIYNNSTNIFPNPYTLFSSPLRNSSGKVLAGYELNGSSIVTKPGIHHSYFIDQNTDLTIINPSEREIYNPSEATITANNLVFPENYTFRTIRGDIHRLQRLPQHRFPKTATMPTPTRVWYVP